MQYSPDNANKVVRGLKTNTRRLKHPGDWYDPARQAVINANGRVRFRVGKVEAVQPGRGKKGVGFQRTTEIRGERLCDISWQDAVAEGAQSYSWSGAGTEPDARAKRLMIAGFRYIWDSIYAGQKGKQWADNPEVWALTVEPVDA